MAHQAARPDMRYAEMRKETFASSDFEGNKAWTPVKLARAGFFFDPKERRPDRLTCFYCGTSTSYGIYLPEDDPFEVHFKLANDCPWIIAQYRAREWKASQARNQQSGAVRRTRREKAGRGTLHPEAGLSSTAGGEGSASGPFPPEAEEMYSARLDTFGDWWPLERKKGFESCSKEKMARAGLVFVGENSCDDSVECMYCGCELGDWDAGDDPWAEHERRKKDVCPFVIRTKAVNGSISAKAEVSDAQSKKTYQVTSRADSPALQPETSAVWDPTDLEEVENVPPKESKPTKSRKGVTRGKKSAKAKPEEDDGDADNAAAVDVVEKPKAKRGAKPTKRRIKKAEDDAEVEGTNDNHNGVAICKPKAKGTKFTKGSRTKKAAKNMESDDEREHDVPEHKAHDVPPSKSDNDQHHVVDNGPYQLLEIAYAESGEKKLGSQQSDNIVDHQIASEMPVDKAESLPSSPAHAQDERFHVDDLSARLFADDSVHIEEQTERTEPESMDTDLSVAAAEEPLSVPVDLRTPRRSPVTTAEPGSPNVLTPRKRSAMDAFDVKTRAADRKPQRRTAVVELPRKHVQDNSAELSGIKNVNKSQLEDIVDVYFEFDSSSQATVDHQSLLDAKNDSVTNVNGNNDENVTHENADRSFRLTSKSGTANIQDASGVSDQQISFSKRPSSVIVARASGASVIDPLTEIMDELSSIAEELMENEDMEEDDDESDEIQKKMEAALICLQGKTEEAEMSFQLTERIREARESGTNVLDDGTPQRYVGHQIQDISEVAPSADRTVLLKNKHWDDRTVLLKNKHWDNEQVDQVVENSMMVDDAEATPHRSVGSKDKSLIAPSADRTVLLRTVKFKDEQAEDEKESDVELPDITPHRSVGTKHVSVAAPSADRTILLASRTFYHKDDSEREAADDDPMQEDELPTIMQTGGNGLKEGVESSDHKQPSEEDVTMQKHLEVMDKDHGTVEYPSPNQVSIFSTPAQLNRHSLLVEAEKTPRLNRGVPDLNSVASMLKILMTPMGLVNPRLSKDDPSYKSLEDGDLRAWVGEERVNMTAGEFIEWVTSEQEKRVREEGERMVREFEREAAKARAILESALAKQRSEPN